MQTCEIISIGDELLIGQTVNTNAAWLGKKLCEIGVVVKKVSTIGDRATAIRDTLDKAIQSHDIVLVTGGLGPTHDDITKAVVTEYFGTELVFHPKIVENLKKRFQRRGYTFPKSNESQAWLPKDAKILKNRVGSAQGMLFEKDNRMCLVMPGVPSEMVAIMEDSGLAFIEARTEGEIIFHHTWRTTNVPESILAEMLDPIGDLENYGKIAFLPKLTGVDVRITIHASSKAEADQRLQAASKFIEARIGQHVFATGDIPFEQVIAELLTKTGKTISVAESCTGGLIAKRLTDIAGSSVFFKGGYLAYSNEMKHKFLAVPESDLQKYGAVSEQVAHKMAAQVRVNCGTDFGLSITGIAGPSGGTQEKPVGLVFIGIADESGVEVQRFVFGNDREMNRERSAQKALQMVYEKLNK